MDLYSDYPRPQFVRSSWESLNGIWDFAFDDENEGEAKEWYSHFPKQAKILVPFSYETKLSGVWEEARHDNVWYNRSIYVDAARLEKNLLILNFEGCDHLTKLWVNGKYAGSHSGGYSRFSFDISLLVNQGKNEITLKAEDSFEIGQPRGKQRWRNNSFGCWYVQTTGIWKPVWMEYVPKLSISSVRMTPDVESQKLEISYSLQVPSDRLDGSLAVETIISFCGRAISNTRISPFERTFSAAIDICCSELADCHRAIKLWSPEFPAIYDVSFRLLDNGECLDEVCSYFAMRSIRIKGASILLNGSPLYQRLILEQGYWKDSGLTAPDTEAFVDEIRKIKALGYNGVRLHQKIEDERFLSLCDREGLLVWSEAPAAYRFSVSAIEEFTAEWMAIVRQNYNHPCIITWVPFNESWGFGQIAVKKDQQFFSKAIHSLTKSMDSSRPVIVNDGWEHSVSDIITLHDYEESGETLKKRYIENKEPILSGEKPFNRERFTLAEGCDPSKRPVILSEFGGIAFLSGEGWGYGEKVSTKEEFVRRFDNITTAVKLIPWICGYCYTQVTDVQQEINGLMDAERHFKIEPEIIREINERDVRHASGII